MTMFYTLQGTPDSCNCIKELSMLHFCRGFEESSFIFSCWLNEWRLLFGRFSKATRKKCVQQTGGYITRCNSDLVMLELGGCNFMWRAEQMWVNRLVLMLVSHASAGAHLQLNHTLLNLSQVDCSSAAFDVSRLGVEENPDLWHTA